jgi:hypothetical protein
MSEDLKIKSEFNEQELKEALRTLPTAEQAEPLRKGEADPAKALREARTTVAETNRTETAPNPLDKLQAAEKASQTMEPRQVNTQLKQITLQRELQHIRRKLPRPERVLSRIVHQPVVRAVSESASKTISRPSGLLGGGLVAFIGTSGYLYLARHIGFTYNYLIFLVLLAGGFVIGLALELLVYVVLGSRRRTD